MGKWGWTRRASCPSCTSRDSFCSSGPMSPKLRLRSCAYSASELLSSRFTYTHPAPSPALPSPPASSRGASPLAAGGSGYISAASRRHLGGISATSRRHLGDISPACRAADRAAPARRRSRRACGEGPRRLEEGSRRSDARVPPGRMLKTEWRRPSYVSSCSQSSRLTSQWRPVSSCSQ